MSSSSCACNILNGVHTLDFNNNCTWNDANVTLTFNAGVNRWELIFYVNGQQVALYVISGDIWDCCGPNIMSKISASCTSPAQIIITPETVCCSATLWYCLTPPG